jgi:Flp pilus assembly pilin Flp
MSATHPNVGRWNKPAGPVERKTYVVALYVRLMSWIATGHDWLGERREGQGLAEYALILVLVSIAAFVALQILGTTISTVFRNVITDLAP